MKIFGLILMLAIGIFAQIPNAAAERLGIFVRVTDGDERPTGIHPLALLEQIAGRAELAVGITVVRASELLASDVRGSVIACGEDLACVSNNLRAAEIDLGLLATIDATSDPALVLVMIVEGKTGKLTGRSIDEASLAEPDAIARLAESNAVRLLAESGHALGGRARIHVTPSDANIIFRDATGVIPAKAEERILLRAGTWSVEASKPGFASKTVELQVLAEKDAELSMTLESESSLLGSPWLWIGVGAIVVGAAVTAFALTQQSEAPPLIPGDDGRVIQTLRPR